MARGRSRVVPNEPWRLPGGSAVHRTKPAPTVDPPDEERETLADWLASSHDLSSVDGLAPLLQAGAALRGFAGVFAGGTASMQARIFMLRTLGERAEPPEWSPAEIDRQFAWLDATKRDTTLKRLNEHGLLSWDTPSRTYRLSSIGRIVLLAVEQVLRVAGESDTEIANTDPGPGRGRVAP